MLALPNASLFVANWDIEMSINILCKLQQLNDELAA
jgi:hypothetical protein